MGGQKGGGEGRGWLAGNFREHRVWRKLSLPVSLLGLGNPRLVRAQQLQGTGAATRPSVASPSFAGQSLGASHGELSPVSPGAWVVPLALGGGCRPFWAVAWSQHPLRTPHNPRSTWGSPVTSLSWVWARLWSGPFRCPFAPPPLQFQTSTETQAFSWSETGRSFLWAQVFCAGSGQLLRLTPDASASDKGLIKLWAQRKP